MINDKKELQLSDFRNWKKKNNEMYFSLFDYISVQFQKHQLSIDTWVAFSEIFLPTFIEVNGLILVEECFNEKQKDYERYKSEGLSKKDIELWINLICLDGLLYDLPGETDEISDFLGKKVVQGWELKLKNDFPNRNFKVSLEKYEDVGDFLITFFEIT